MVYKQILAVDPGKQCGLAWFIDAGEHQHIRSASLAAGDAPAAIFDTLNALSILRSLIVIERWTMTSVKHSRQPDALEIIGAAKFIGRLLSVDVELQNRADRERCSPALAAFIAPVADEHERDAVQHLVVAMAKHGYAEHVKGLNDMILGK